MIYQRKCGGVGVLIVKIAFTKISEVSANAKLIEGIKFLV